MYRKEKENLRTENIRMLGRAKSLEEEGRLVQCLRKHFIFVGCN